MVRRIIWLGFPELFRVLWGCPAITLGISFLTTYFKTGHHLSHVKSYSKSEKSLRSASALAFLGLLLLALTTEGVFFVARVDASHPATGVVALVHSPATLVNASKILGSPFSTNVTIDNAVDIFTWQVTVTYDASFISLISMNVVGTYFDQCIDSVTMAFKQGPAYGGLGLCNAAAGDVFLYSPFLVKSTGNATLAYTMLVQTPPTPQPRALTCGSTVPAYPCPTIMVKITWRVVGSTPGFSSIHILTDTEDPIAGTGLADSTIQKVLYNTEDGFFSNIPGMAAPHAKYTVTPAAPDVYPNATLGKSVGFNGMASANATSYSWNFNDGTPAGTGTTTSHTYSGLPDQPPTLSIGESKTTAAKNEVITLGVNESDFENFITSTRINWGDGNITIFPGQLPFHPPTLTHSYTRAGVFNVNVTVTDALPLRSFLTVTGSMGAVSKASRVIVFLPGNSVSKTIRNTITNVLPVLSFTQDKSVAFKGDLITLTITASDPDGTIASTRVDWGDSTVQTFTGVAGSPSHSYANKGNYTIAVSVTDDDGGTTTQTSRVTVQDRPPTAAFTFSPASPTTGDTATFTDSSTDADGTVASWSWDFGDGSNSTVRNPTHKYTSSGTFTVKLTVTDNDGSTKTTSQTITVRASSFLSNPLLLAGVGLAVLVILALLVWWFVVKKRRAPPEPPSGKPGKTS